VSNAPSKPVSFSRPKVGYFSNRPRISICVLLYRRGSHWRDFGEMWHWKLLLQSVEIWLKSAKTIGHFTWRRALHCHWRQKFPTKALLRNNQYFYSADSDTQYHNTHTERIAVFPLQQWLRERATLLGYTYTAYLVGTLHSLHQMPWLPRYEFSLLFA